MLVATLALVLSVTGQKLPFDVRASDTELLKYGAVQKELKLTPDQITHVEQAENEYRSESKRTHSWDSDKEHAAVAKYLRPDQQKRLREISMQNSGPIVLIVDFVADRIGAGPERQKQIKAAFSSSINEAIKPIQEQVQKEVQQEMRDAGNDPDEMERRAKKVSEHADKISSSIDDHAITKNAARRILSTLTPSERKAWTDLQGAPFPVEKLNSKDGDN